MVEEMAKNHLRVENNTAEMTGNFVNKFINNMIEKEEKDRQHKDDNNVSKKKKDEIFENDSIMVSIENSVSYRCQKLKKNCFERY